jgi:restriction endonuclease S subunit
LEGLDVTVQKLSEIRNDNEKFRIDPGYFAKLPVLTAKIIESIPHLRLGDASAVFRKGIFDIKADSYTENGVPFVRIGNLHDGLIDSKGIAFISPEMHAAENETALDFGDIVLSKTGYAAAAFVNLLQCNVSQDTIAVRLSSSGRKQFESGYIVAYLNSRYGLALMSRQFQGNVQEHLSLSDGKKLLVPLLSKELQAEINRVLLGSNEYLHSAYKETEKASSLLVSALGLSQWKPPDPLTYTLSFTRAFNERRLDAEFHRPSVDALHHELAKNFDLKRVGDLGAVENGQTVPYDDDGDVPVIRSGDLSNIQDDSRFLRTRSDAPIFRLERGDVLISSIGFGSIGKVQVFDKDGIYGTVSEVTVIRQREMNPYFVAGFLRSRFGQMQIDRYITGATGQLHLYKRDVKELFLPVISTLEQKRFETLALEAADARAQSKACFDRAKRAIEIAIEDSESVALKYLKERAEHVKFER